MTVNRKTTTLLILTASLIFFSAPALSCDVPVYRYALERWPADTYEVLVFHRGALSSEDHSIVEYLEKSSSSFTNANYTVNAVDLSADVSASMLELFETIKEPEIPCLAIRYPKSFPYSGIIWNGRLTMDVAKKLVDSPVRQEIARRIIDGESAVWILLESGDRSKDDAAADTLESQLSAMEETLKLPGFIPDIEGVATANNLNMSDLSIAFSLLRISGNDPAESIFIAMLMHSEPDLFEYASHPMAFPVYGRGRALYAVVGDGITERNIQWACEFITGACSCEVKALNPGVDLLISADWEQAVGESWVQYAELPPLVGLSELAEASGSGGSDDSTVVSHGLAGDADSVSHPAAAVQGKQKDASQPGQSGVVASTGHLLRNFLVAIGIIIVVITILTLKVGVQKTGGK